jgi:transcriptional regulator with XRE-family HTH domain
MKIIERIRKVRTQKNLSQEYVASFLGIDTSSYHRLERGVSPLTVERLELIAQAFEIDLGDFLAPSENEDLKTVDSDPYIIHLEEEVRFLRVQLHENIKIMTAQAYENGGIPQNPTGRNRASNS